MEWFRWSDTHIKHSTPYVYAIFLAIGCNFSSFPFFFFYYFDVWKLAMQLNACRICFFSRSKLFIFSCYFYAFLPQFILICHLQFVFPLDGLAKICRSSPVVGFFIYLFCIILSL